MAKPTVRDIHEIVARLDRDASAFKEVANATPLEDSIQPAVPLTIVSVLEHATFLEGLSATLKKLIPEDEVSVETDIAPEK